jgi:hypothetical protein
MKALIWKECHENLKWAALILLLFGAGIALAGPPSIMRLTTLFFLAIAAAVSAAALGFLQVFFEARGDRRALLLHRPVSHSQVFLSKAIVGVTLYLLAVGIPFAAAIAWVATPGHVAEPFRPGMALPWLADILTGVVWYFAGMLTAQREARWYGSRGLGFVTALLASLLVWLLPDFWQALVAIAILGTALAVACWGSFLTGGAYTSQPRIAQAALAVSLLAGLLIAGYEAKLLLGAWFDSNERSYYMLDRAGGILIVHQQDGKDTQVTDLEGRVPRELEGKLADPNTLREMEASRSRSLAAMPLFDSYRNPGRYCVRYGNDSKAPGEVWYYVHDEGRAFGYDRQSKRLIGSIGPDGFAGPDEQPKGRFHGRPTFSSFLFDAGPAAYLDFADGVYTVDFAQRRLRVLFRPAEGQTVCWATRWYEERHKRSLVVACTEQSIHVIDEAGTSLLGVPLAYDRPDAMMVSVGRLENPDRFVLWYEPSPAGGFESFKSMPGYLVEYDTAGHEIARRTVPPQPLAEVPSAVALFGLATSITEAVVLAAGNGPIGYGNGSHRDRGMRVLPLVLGMTTRYFIPGTGPHRRADRSVVLAFRGLIVLSAVICALVCFVLARRHAFSRQRCIGWSVCGLLFGPAGLLLMLAIQDWPARVVCPGCRKLRVVTRERCEHCGASHAAPERDGTEVLAVAQEIAAPAVAVR